MWTYCISTRRVGILQGYIRHTKYVILSNIELSLTGILRCFDFDCDPCFGPSPGDPSGGRHRSSAEVTRSARKNKTGPPAAEQAAPGTKE